MEELKLLPAVLSRAAVSTMASKSLVVFRSGVDGLGVESADRCFSNGKERNKQSRADGKNSVSGNLGRVWNAGGRRC